MISLSCNDISFFNFFHRKQELWHDQIPTPVASYRARLLLSASLLWDRAPSLFFPKRRLLVIINLEMVTVKKTVCPSSSPPQKKIFFKINKTLINGWTLHFVLNGVSSVPKNTFATLSFSKLIHLLTLRFKDWNNIQEKKDEVALMSGSRNDLQQSFWDWIKTLSFYHPAEKYISFEMSWTIGINTSIL